MTPRPARGGRAAWSPRGTPTWPGWRDAAPGTRVEHVRSGRRGTLRRVVYGRTAGTRYAVIAWDPMPPMFPAPIIGRVVAPAYDLRPITDDASGGPA